MDKLLVHFGYHYLLSFPYKRTFEIVEAKLAIILLNVFGLPLYAIGILLNIGTWKADILFGIGVLWGLSRMIFTIIKEYQDIKKRGRDLKKD